ncbi:MucBP domain-containing protein [bacterium]|nr:MucBP domain-containing protein [bacterium]
MKKLNRIIMATAIFITTCFSNLGVVLASVENPQPGEVFASKTAKIVEGRKAEVTINVNGNSFNEQEQLEREIVLVLDASSSMQQGKKISSLKQAAKNLVTKLLDESNQGKIKVGVIYYGTTIKKTCSLSTDPESVKKCIDIELSNNEGTNVQLGIKKGKNLFTNNKNEKNMIILSDGIPTYYNDNNDVLHGSGGSDEHEEGNPNFSNYTIKDNQTLIVPYYDKDNETVLYTCEHKFTNWFGNIIINEWENSNCTENTGKKPSEAALEEIKSFNGKVYTIGLEVTSQAKTFLESLATVNGKNGIYYNVANATDLDSVFEQIQVTINKIATNVKVVDHIPSTFTLDKEYLLENYGPIVSSKTENNITTEVYEKSVTTITYHANNTQDIIWNIGDLNAEDNNTLKFRVIANKDYYGSMFTNDGAEVTGKAVDGNKFYSETNPLKIQLENPVVPIPAVTEDDQYTSNRNEKLTVTPEEGIRKNDYNSKETDGKNVTSVLDKLVIDMKTKYGSLDLDNNGSFNYKPNSKDFMGQDEFKYHIETTITYDDGTTETILNSNTSTVKINVVGKPATYVVKYQDRAGNEIHSEKNSTGTYYVWDDVTETAINVDNYKLLSTESASKTITLKENAKENVIIFIYELEDTNVTVKYLEKGTNKVLAPETKGTGKVTDSYTATAKVIGNYKLVSNQTQTITLAKEGNVITFYYELKDTNVIIKYVDENNNNLVPEEKGTGKINSKYTANAKTEQDDSIFKKYNLESEPVQSIILSGTNENIIVFRYSLKKATIKVHYYEIDTNNKLSEDIELSGKVGEEYTTLSKKIDNWELVDIPENAKGILDLENEDVIYYYQKVNGKLTINYIDDNGNTLLPSEEFIKQTGTDYQTEAKTIENYELSKVIGNEKGIYTKEDSVVTYVYEYVMGQGDMKDPIEEKPYTGITETNNTLDYILASSSLLSAAILVILKKKFN